MSRCQQITGGGHQCTRLSEPGSHNCWQHGGYATHGGVGKGYRVVPKGYGSSGSSRSSRKQYGGNPNLPNLTRLIQDLEITNGSKTPADIASQLFGNLNSVFIDKGELEIYDTDEEKMRGIGEKISDAIGRVIRFPAYLADSSCGKCLAYSIDRIRNPVVNAYGKDNGTNPLVLAYQE